MTKPTHSRRRQAEQRRQQLLDAALEQFAANGYDGASIRDIAHRAGVTEALVYHYFRNKEHLFEEVLKARSFAPVLRRVLDDAGDAPVADVLHQLLQEFLDLLWHNASMARMFFIEFMRNAICYRYFRAMVEENSDALTRYLQSQQERGRLRADMHAQSVAGMVLGMAFSLFLAYGQASEREWKERRSDFLQHSVPTILYGIGNEMPRSNDI